MNHSDTACRMTAAWSIMNSESACSNQSISNHPVGYPQICVLIKCDLIKIWPYQIRLNGCFLTIPATRTRVGHAEKFSVSCIFGIYGIAIGRRNCANPIKMKNANLVERNANVLVKGLILWLNDLSLCDMWLTSGLLLNNLHFCDLHRRDLYLNNLHLSDLQWSSEDHIEISFERSYQKIKIWKMKTETKASYRSLNRYRAPSPILLSSTCTVTFRWLNWTSFSTILVRLLFGSFVSWNTMVIYGRTKSDEVV